ncbi:MAG: AAA family ATPase [Deltaproteobacteria bacterium]|nr:AAA family ATPase [Deltaproteobacteria bacterium]
MKPIVIVTGNPGAGKSTLARRLALAAERGLHLDSDLFYGFPARPIDPTTPDSREQNETILRALARCARTFSEGAYDVFFDGVVGPWVLPLVRAELRGLELHYVVLRANEADALARVRSRDGEGQDARVSQMYRAFAEVGEHAARVVATSGRRRRDVFAEVSDGLRAGRFLLGAE